MDDGSTGTILPGCLFAVCFSGDVINIDKITGPWLPTNAFPFMTSDISFAGIELVTATVDGRISDQGLLFGSGSIMTTPTPEPAAVSFVSIGIIGLVVMRKRKTGQRRSSGEDGACPFPVAWASYASANRASGRTQPQ
jgi:hypothetical protein